MRYSRPRRNLTRSVYSGEMAVPFLGRSAGHRNSCLYSDVWRMIPLTHGRDAPSAIGSSGKEKYTKYTCALDRCCALHYLACVPGMFRTACRCGRHPSHEGDLSKLETPSVDKLSRPLSGQRRQRMPVSPMKKRGCLGYSIFRRLGEFPDAGTPRSCFSSAA